MRDREGRFWVIPPGENAWEKREPFTPARMLNSNRFPAITCTCSVCRSDFRSKPDPALPASDMFGDIGSRDVRSALRCQFAVR